jgi:hypothetical protein
VKCDSGQAGGSTPALRSGGPGYKYQQAKCLSLLKYFVFSHLNAVTASCSRFLSDTGPPGVKPSTLRSVACGSKSALHLRLLAQLTR